MRATPDRTLRANPGRVVLGSAARILLVLACGCSTEDPIIIGASSQTITGSGTQSSSSSGDSGTGFSTFTSSDSGDWGEDGVPETRFASLGDYGSAGAAAERVSVLVHQWSPDFVITQGDNNYPVGSATTIDDNVGQYYSAFIGSYSGKYGSGSARNRFWPSPGNHDWGSPNLEAYRDYFDLPGNGRYYEMQVDDVHLFSYDSDTHEPDGVGEGSDQAKWLEEALGASTACWKVVFMHHPPYSSGSHGSSEALRLPYAEWGADVVVAGHDHHYERLEVDDIVYFVNGLGGRSIYSLDTPLDETRKRYNEDYGALFFMVREGELRSAFYNADGELIDAHTIEKSCP